MTEPKNRTVFVHPTTGWVMMGKDELRNLKKSSRRGRSVLSEVDLTDDGRDEGVPIKPEPPEEYPPHPYDLETECRETDDPLLPDDGCRLCISPTPFLHQTERAQHADSHARKLGRSSSEIFPQCFPAISSFPFPYPTQDQDELVDSSTSEGISVTPGSLTKNRPDIQFAMPRAPPPKRSRLNVDASEQEDTLRGHQEDTSKSSAGQPGHLIPATNQAFISDSSTEEEINVTSLSLPGSAPLPVPNDDPTSGTTDRVSQSTENMVALSNPPDYMEEVEELAKSCVSKRAALNCMFPKCQYSTSKLGASFRKSVKRLIICFDNHIRGHFELPLYFCKVCHIEIKLVGGHRMTHKGQQLTSWVDDRYKSSEVELIELLRKCFGASHLPDDAERDKAAIEDSKNAVSRKGKAPDARATIPAAKKRAHPAAAREVSTISHPAVSPTQEKVAARSQPIQGPKPKTESAESFSELTSKLANFSSAEKQFVRCRFENCDYQTSPKGNVWNIGKSIDLHIRMHFKLPTWSCTICKTMFASPRIHAKQHPGMTPSRFAQDEVLKLNHKLLAMLKTCFEPYLTQINTADAGESKQVPRGANTAERLGDENQPKPSSSRRSKSAVGAPSAPETRITRKKAASNQKEVAPEEPAPEENKRTRQSRKTILITTVQKKKEDQKSEDIEKPNFNPSKTSEPTSTESNLEVYKQLCSRVMKFYKGHVAECLVCGSGKQLHRFPSLESHLLSHIDENPYFCALCDVGFRYVRSLKDHQKRNHGKNETGSEDRRKDIEEKLIKCLSQCYPAAIKD